MQRFALGPFSSYTLGNDSRKERREKGLNKSYIAIAFVILGFGLLISSASYATAPGAGDIPDFRLIAPQSAVLDLDDFAIDYDDYAFMADTDLSWTITSNGTFPNADKDANNVISLGQTTMPSAGSAGSYDFQVADATGSDVDTSEVHVVTAIGTSPSLSQDFLLSPAAGAAGFTHALDIADGTAPISAVSVGQAQGSAALTWNGIAVADVYDASMNAAYSPRAILASGTDTVTYGGLTAAIDAAGQFTLTSLAGGLSEPVIVSFKGSTSASDWDGVSVLVSSALLARRQTYQEVSPAYNVDEGFETTALGRIRARTVGNNNNVLLPGVADCVWILDGAESVKASAASGGTRYGSAVVVANTSLPAGLQTADASFDGDHSGQALEISLTAAGTAGSGAVVTMNSPVAAQAGYAYAVECSLASDAPDALRAPYVMVALHTFGFSEISAAGLAPADSLTPNDNQTAVNSSPQLSDGWVRVRTYLEPSAAALADAAAANQEGLAMRFIVYNVSSAGAVKLYVDNVKIYKTALPDDLAFGNAKIAFAGRPDISVGSRIRAYVDPTLNFSGFEGDPVYLNFENGTGALATGTAFTNGNANGWFLGNTPPTGATASVGASISATKVEAADANWLTMSLAATNNSASAGVGFIARTRRMAPVSVGTTEFTPGVFVLSSDVHTNSGATNPPNSTLVLSSKDFRTFGFAILQKQGDNAGGTNGAVRRLRLPVSMRNNNKLIVQVAVGQASDNLQGDIHFDNVQIDHIQDSAVYADFSLFQ